MRANNLTLLTDLYELTMMQGYFKNPTNQTVVFDMFYRNNPCDGGFAICAGLEQMIALGVDSCWIHRAREVFDSEEGKELKKQWGVPEEYIGVGHCVLGYRDCEYPTAKPRKDGFVIRV